MKEYTKNFLTALNDYGIMSCDLAGCFIKTEIGNSLLENIVGIDPNKFQPIGLDVLEGHMEINENPKPGEKTGATIGCLLGLTIDFASLGIIPAALLLYDISVSVYRAKKK